ncbi:MAG: dual specificity protein phosphatase family protein [Thermodesulfovibrionales bacterium]|nr:dual specificity protein phosphatase family protein [Thermodesulfovibrionales bacterium]
MLSTESLSEDTTSSNFKSYEKNTSSINLPEGARVSKLIFGLPGLSNVGQVSEGIFRGAQPLPEGYLTLKKMGIKTVINLRNHSEKEAVEAAGMKSIEIPLSVLKKTSIEDVNRIIEIISNPENQPVYVHCRHGQDRTGIVIAAYRMRIDGWSLKEAEAEMQAFGFNDLWKNLKEFIRHYAKTLGKATERQ